MGERIFLPARRGETIVVFEHSEVPEKRRWEFVAVAVMENGQARREGWAHLSPKELNHCAKIGALLPRLEAEVGAMTPFDLHRTEAALDLPKELAMVEGSALLTLTLYLQLQRDTLVTAASVARYRARAAAERVEAGLSASIYTQLLKVGDAEGAGSLLDQDLAVVPERPPRTRDWGFFFGQAAGVRRRQARDAEAIALLHRSLTCWPTAHTWRRIGGIHEAQGQMSQAISAFESAEKLGPLPAQATIRLARWLLAEERIDDARRTALLARERGAGNAHVILDQLPSQAD